MGFKLGITIQSLLSQAVIFLRHLAGARLVVGKQQLTEDDPTLYLNQAVHIRFMNRGQTPVIIDNQIILLHGEVYVEGDTSRPRPGSSLRYPLPEAVSRKDSVRPGCGPALCLSRQYARHPHPHPQIEVAMPEMRKEQAPQAVQVSLGDVQIEATPPTAGEQRSRRLESAAASMTIPGSGFTMCRLSTSTTAAGRST